ncbi:hypothetical protein [Tenacibaculum finnmarkense]|nr:hypothetical protein [Tenacibaculum finnmarkense]MCD8418655.1 hypothetical protein [Tenacibaculum finnmarkense genomovar finnmarkense]MCG8211009.1 hypothetical protein [Tenacibaculum finnmarkense genomovar finnmarkense]MCG8247710.1 hypothetical protein [Tenacibaculum finnmarkense genomovar finnmarkense]MCG8729513.1 hypothetical protein [Tenacibaculum finnmarkense]MCG8852326.1 hypothetical protein [Tenacibaculum finnmarkense]
MLGTHMEKNGLAKRVKESQVLATYLEAELNKIGVKAWRNNNALTVVLEKPSDKIYQLASEEDIAHVICVPGIKKEQLTVFIEDLKKELVNS